ncbi:response regulator [Brucella pseudogrignonensis]|uniref:response regulator n=1 Tax=Brucella pseudogrignonensis TaxID=419475 RepID=UPI0038D234D0
MPDTDFDENCRVLLIDDEIALLNALTSALESDGLICKKATAAGQALSILSATPSIELIISDIKMPGMNGINLVQQVRERFIERSWLQIIFVTAYATLDNSVDALRLAASDFLYKPVRREVLVKSARAALEKASTIKREMNFRLQGSEHLDRLAGELQSLKGLLSPKSPSQHDGETAAEDPQKPLTKERLLALIQSNQVKKKLFKDDLFSDPVWNMLLDLMQQHLLGKEVAVSSLYFSSGAPIATASRRLAEMEKAGLVSRKHDRVDKRRQIVTLTPASYQLIEEYFSTIDRI